MKEPCPVSRLFNQLTRKWAVLILRELKKSKTARFNKLLSRLGGISPRTLSQRLKDFEKLDFVTKREFKEIPLRVEYSLTPKGTELVEGLSFIDEWVNTFSPTLHENNELPDD